MSLHNFLVERDDACEAVMDAQATNASNQFIDGPAGGAAHDKALHAREALVAEFWELYGAQLS